MYIFLIKKIISVLDYAIFNVIKNYIARARFIG